MPKPLPVYPGVQARERRALPPVAWQPGPPMTEEVATGANLARPSRRLRPAVLALLVVLAVIILAAIVHLAASAPAGVSPLHVAWLAAPAQAVLQTVLFVPVV